MDISQKNKKILIYEGYRYRKDKSHLQSTTWRCTKAGCKGRLTDYGKQKKPTTSHMHGPDPALNQSFRFKSNVKKLAEEQQDKPRIIIQRAISSNHQTEEDAVAGSSYESTRQIIYRKRKAIVSQQNEDFLNFNRKTTKGEGFLIFDSGENNDNRMLIFGTKRNIDLLLEFPNWSVDETFTAAPVNFAQLYTVHAIIDAKSIPLVYALLPDKRQSTYTALFRKLVQLEPNLNPATILSDFECAAYNALKIVFPQVQIVGCFFHLSQNLWRKIQKSHLVKHYTEREDIRTKCKMLLALSYIPEKDVQFSFEIVTEKFPEELNVLVTYWENNYVGKRIHNIEPRFPINMWNMHQRIRSDLPKTNNSLEAWHNSFQKVLDCHHPSVSKIHEHMILEQNLTDIRVSRFKSGIRQLISANNKYLQQKRKLQAMIDVYSFRLVEDYLKAAAYNITL